MKINDCYDRLRTYLMLQLPETATYLRRECVVFLKTHEAFGGLSNMAAGYSLLVNGARILTAEALYQACRFPRLPEVQKLIIGQASPMAAKMKSKPYRKDSRPDWDQVNVLIMSWCLQVKLVQNWERFGALLLSTGEKPIVEESKRDAFWGAKPKDTDTLVGMNVLGRLLMELREQLRGPKAEELQVVQPPSLPQFLLLGRPIRTIQRADIQLQPLDFPGSLNSSSVKQLTIEEMLRDSEKA